MDRMQGNPHRRSAGQIAVEFIIVYSLVLLIFIILFGVVVNQRAATLSAQQYSAMQLVTQDISGYIDQALVAGSGYNATLAIPASSNLQPYNLFLSSGGAVIANETLGKTNIRATAYSSARSIVINGTISSTYNGVTLYNIPTYSGSISVANVGGTIYVNVPTSGLAAYAQSMSARGAGNTEAFNFKNTSVHGIVVPQSASMNKAWNGGSWTINTWFMDTHAPQTGTGRDLIEESNGCTTGMWLQNTSVAHYSLNTIQWYSSGGACTNAGAVSITSGGIPYNTWVMGTSVFSYNGAGGGYVEICVDAHCSNTTWSSTSPSNYSKYGYTFLINDNDCCGGWQIGGELANVQLYSSALTQAQIAQLYREGITGAPVNASSIEGWWPLDGNANDYSGNGNNGVPGYTLNYSNVAQVNVNLASGTAAGSGGSVIGAASSAGSASVMSGAFTVSPVTDANGNATVFVTSNSTAGKVNVTINAFNYNTSLQSHLVGWWPLDEGYGSAVHDMSGHGNNGTFYSPSWIPFAGSTAFQAGVFSGQGSGTTGYGGSYVNSSSSPVLKPLHMTVGAWVKPYSYTPWMDVAGVQEGTGWGSYYLAMSGTTSGDMIFGTYNGTVAVHAASAPVPLNSWSYVVGEYNGTNASIYVNGKLSGSVPDTQLVYYLSSAPFRIGNLGGFADWNGIVSNVQVYGTALSAKQIAQQYAAGVTAMPLSSSGLAGWWPLDGNANDYSAYANGGNAFNVIYSNMQGTSSTGNQMPVANFNGASSYIDLGNPASLQFSSGSTIAMSAWVKIASCNHSGAIIGHGTSSYTLYYYPASGGTCNINFASSTVANIGAGVPISTGAWHNVVVVNNIGTNVYIYIDGTQYGPYTFTNTYAYTEDLRVGDSQSDSGFFFNGSIADVQIYNTSLTQYQVQQLYAQGPPLYARVNVSLS